MTAQDIIELKHYLDNKFKQQEVRFDARFTRLANIVENQGVKLDRLSEVVEGHGEAINRMATNLEHQTIRIDQLANVVEQQGIELRVEIAQVYEKLDAKIDSAHDKLNVKIDTKVDRLLLDVGDAFEHYHGEHGQRIIKLEQRTT